MIGGFVDSRGWNIIVCLGDSGWCYTAVAFAPGGPVMYYKAGFPTALIDL